MKDPYLAEIIARANEQQAMPEDDNPYIDVQGSSLVPASIIAGQFQPDAFAKAQQLSADTGLPAEVLARNPDQAARIERERRLAEIEAMYPGTAQWLRDPENMAVAQDDLDTLTGMETALSGWIRGDWARAVAGGVVGDTAGMGASGTGTLLEIAGRRWGQFQRGGDPTSVSNQVLQQLGVFAPADIAQSTGVGIQDVGDSVQAFGELIKPPTERRNLATDTMTGLGQVAGQVGLTAVAPWMAGVTMAGQGAEIQRDRAAKAGATQDQADLTAVAGAGWTALTEAVGIGYLMRRLPKGVQDTIKKRGVDMILSGLGEGTQEVTEGVGGDLLARATYDPNAVIGAGAAKDFTVAGLVGTIARGVAHIRPRARVLAASEESAATMEALHDLAQKSKTGGRAARRLQDFIAQVGLDIEAFTDAETFVKLFQSPAEAHAAAAEATGNPDALLIALASKADIGLPIGPVVAKLLASPIGEAYMKASKLAPGLRTTGEQRSADPEADVYGLLDEVRGAMDAARKPAENQGPAFDAIMPYLMQTGRVSDGDAARYAGLYQRLMTRIAADTGQTVEQVIAQNPVEVWSATVGDMLARTNPQGVPTSVATILAAMRTGKLPTDRDIYGPSLVDMLVKAGGLQDSGGELSAMDARLARPGLVSMAGLTFDEALTRARAAGYLPPSDNEGVDTLGVNDLIDAIRDDLSEGGKFAIYGEADAKLLKFREDVREWERELPGVLEDGEAMADLLALPDAQIIDRVNRAGSGALEQASQPGGVLNPLPQSDADSAPVGAWVALTDIPDVRGTLIAQVRDVPIAGIDAKELDRDGRIAPEKRKDVPGYVERLAAGEQPPNLFVIERVDGGLHLVDGHRRLVAARDSGRETVRALVSPIVETASDGKVALTLEIARTQQGSLLFQSAYHGSPHRFEKFSLQKIGTGEGAQAYGWGLYFASRKEIAEGYRKALAGPKSYFPDGTRLVGGIFQKGLSDERAAEILLAPASSKDAAMATIARNRGLYPDSAINKAFEMVDSGAVVFNDNTGQLYSAEIPDDADLLDYDKPLSEQPAKVRAAIESLKGTPTWDRLVEQQLGGPVMEQATGRDLYLALAGSLNITDPGPASGEQKASHALYAAGIPGLRYLDGGSRQPDAHDKKVLSALESHGNDPEAAADFLAKFYRPASGRAAYRETTLKQARSLLTRHNYVIWDEGAIQDVQTFYQSQVEQTDTPAFRKWFGDSKVVDADGEPLVVYHGTANNFDSFERGHRGGSENETAKLGHWFTDSPAVAAGFATRPSDAFVTHIDPATGDIARWEDGEPKKYRAPDETGSIMPVYLSIQNPLRFKSAEGSDAFEQFMDFRDTWAKYIDRVQGKAGHWRKRMMAIDVKETNEAMLGWLKENGYDGIAIEQTAYDAQDAQDGTATQYLVLSSTQIKSATGNNGDFDPNNPSILKQKERGSIEFRQNQQGGITSLIRMMEDANASTLLHEFGHLYLEILARNAAASPALAGDLTKLRGWFGANTAQAEAEVRAMLRNAERKGKAKREQAAAVATTKQAEHRAALLTITDAKQRALAMRGRGDSEAAKLFREWKLAERTANNVDLETIELRAAVKRLDENPNTMAEVAAGFGMRAQDAATRALQTPFHELFARGFEAYLAEGKAPAKGLKGVMRRFKAWIVQSYRDLKDLNVTINDDVRSVFDRMLASDDEIEAQRDALSMAPALPVEDARKLGMSEHAIGLYARAIELAKESLTAKVLRAKFRENKAWYKAQIAVMEAQVRAEADEMPVYRAIAAIQSKAVPKLSGEELNRRYPGGFAQTNLLKHRVYSAKGGESVDMVAGLLGYPSGDALVQAMASADPVNQYVKAEAENRVRERHGDPMTDGTIQQQAQAALHNSRMATALEAEIELLSELAKEPPPKPGAIREAARRIIASVTVRKLNPNQHLVAERKAARLAAEFAGKGKFSDALAAKRAQAINAALYSEAMAAKIEAERARKYLTRMGSTKVRQKLGKARGDYLEQIDALLERFSLKKLTQRQVQRLTSLSAWLKKQDENDVDVQISDKLRDEAFRRPFQELTIGDVRELRDAVKNIHHLASLKGKLILGKETRDAAKIDASMAASVVESHKARPDMRGHRPVSDKVRKAFMQGRVLQGAATDIARELDGFKDIGAVWANTIQAVRGAINNFMNPALEQAQKDMADIYLRHYTKAEIRAWRDPVAVATLGNELWEKQAILSVALNWGNEGNREALRTQGKPVTDEQAAHLFRTMDARDWNFVRDIWVLIDSYWPAIEEAQKRRTGLAPAKVEALPFTVDTKDGKRLEIAGGYYPLKFQADSVKSMRDEAEDFYKAIRTGKTAKAATRKGHTIERVGSGGRTVNLDVGIVGTHLRDVIRDLHLGDAVNYVHSVLNGPEFSDAIGATGLLEHRQALEVWLKDAASGEIAPRVYWERAARSVRQNFTASVLTWKPVSALLQVTGVMQSAVVLGKKNMASALAQYLRHPVNLSAHVAESSAAMRQRFTTHAEAVQEVANAEAGRFAEGKSAMIRWGYYMIGRVQREVDTVTWLAAEAKGEELFGDDRTKVLAYADDAVERAQGTQEFTGKSPLQRGTLGDNVRQSEMIRAATTLMGYMIAKGNVAYERTSRTNFRDPVQAFNWAGDMAMLFVIESLLVGLIRGAWPGDEDKDGSRWDDLMAFAATEGLFGVIGSTPGLGMFSSQMRGYDGGGAVASLFGNIFDVYQQAEQGEADAAAVKASVKLAGATTGIPSGQINKTIDAINAASGGKTIAPYEYLTGPPKK